MPTGAITSYIDVAQIVLYAFWVFLAGLIWYLRTEDKREGYPLVSDSGAPTRTVGFPPMPRRPKTFLLANGETRYAPRIEPPPQPVRARPIGGWLASPLQPVGDPMLDGVGPAAYALRAEVPDRTVEGEARIVPLRTAPAFSVNPRDPDPRGMPVIGADGRLAGTVRDIWVDRAEVTIRFYEVEVATPPGTHRVLVPVNYTMIWGRRRRVSVSAIRADQFATAPQLSNPEAITLREEDRILAYFAGGYLYATPQRLGPVL